jgi:oxaloacetate decarboxylase alpha subunit
MGYETGIDVDTLWGASDLVDEFIGDEPVTPLAPRVAVRAAQFAIPAGLVAAIDSNLRAHGAADRMDEVLEELRRIRIEVGSPPLASPIGQILGSQALIHVLGSSRYSTVIDEVRDLVLGEFGTPPGEIDPGVRRAVELIGGPARDDDPLDLDELREDADGLASSEEELLLLALFGDEAIPLLKAIRNRSSREETLLAGEVDRARAERIRELVRIVQETGVGEITIEEEGMRVSVRRTEDRVGAAQAANAVNDDTAAPPAPPRDDVIRVESPMVGTFYRAPSPGAPPFVDLGDVVAAGQTLCILEAMKLMNELKADKDGIVSAIHVENAAPVEFGQLLFELEPVNGRPPVDAL